MNASVIARLLGSLIISSCEIGREAGEFVNLYLPVERRMDLDHMTGYQMEIMIHTLSEEQQENLLKRSFGTVEQQQKLMAVVKDEPMLPQHPERKAMTVTECHETLPELFENKETTAEEDKYSDAHYLKPKWGLVIVSLIVLFISAYVILPQAGVTRKDVISWLVWIGGGLTLIVGLWKGISGS